MLFYLFFETQNEMLNRLPELLFAEV